jgi:hypothetical protein
MKTYKPLEPITPARIMSRAISRTCPESISSLSLLLYVPINPVNKPRAKNSP